MEKKSDFGLIGLAVMGQNLILNVESRGFQCSVYNRTTSVTDEFLADEAKGRNIHGFHDLAEFVQSLERPRKVMMLIKSTAGFDRQDRDAVDAVIGQLVPLLEEGDLIIDGGNTFFEHSERRAAELADKGLLFIGTGVSGGEEGALKGPAIMPGGPKASWGLVEPIFTAISAKVDDVPCVAHLGEGGAGHYVKMVHNGIEYGDMQLICEAYNIFRHAGIEPAEMAEIFEEWNRGELESYLIQITAKILAQTDPDTGSPMVDVIQDRAGSKGTGMWTVLCATQLGQAVSTINAALEARVLSSVKEERVAASSQLAGPDGTITGIDKATLVEQVRQALFASKIISYAQGMDMLKQEDAERGWGLDFGQIATIWRGGCIIRARFLNDIKSAYEKAPDLANLMLDPVFREILEKGNESWREVVALGVKSGVPVPAMSASLGYYDSYRQDRLPANLLQAQRDFFGAHTYERVDKEPGEMFHTDWPDVIEEA